MVFNKAAAQICEGSLGDPVINIDFGRGSANFGPGLGAATNYNFVTMRSPNGEGDYTIVKTTTGLNGGWYNIFNHTPNDFNGYMMIVNAARSPGIFYESSAPIDLCPNTTYEFAAWVYNLLRTNGIRPNITFYILSINDEVLGTYNTGDLPNMDPQWRQYGLQFRTTSTSQVKIRMVNNGQGGIGNDIALDDITFRACGAQISSQIGSTGTTETNICEQSNASFNLSARVDGNVTMRYQWQLYNGNGWVDIPDENKTEYTAVFNNALPGEYRYRLVMGSPQNFNSVSCRTSSPVLTINVNKYPTPNAISNGPVCVGDAILLDVADATGTYEWRNPAGEVFSTEKSPNIANANFGMAGTYTVKVNSLGCEVSSTVEVSVVNPPVPKVEKSAVEICQGTTVMLNASGGTTYSWLPTIGLSSSAIANPIASPDKTTLYTVSISNGACIRTAQVNVTVFNLPKSDAGTDQVMLLGNSVTLHGKVDGDNVTFFWSPELGLDDPRKLDPVASPTVSTEYTLNVVSGNGCVSAADQVFVRVFEKITVPPSFSPNGDGINDLWNITAIETYEKPKVSILNRYGEVIYETTDYFQKPWNGKQNNKDVPVGVYYYIINLDAKSKPLSGSLTLIR
ncbi:gliding motility-associated C-terminal domain-containing protein [Pedobacter sp. PWIIR3]